MKKLINLFFISMLCCFYSKLAVANLLVGSSNQTQVQLKGCIQVPENHFQPEVKIQLCYQFLKPYDPAKKTFFFLIGGPGASFDYYLLFKKFWLSTHLGQNYNLLFFNPRGVGNSTEITQLNLAEHDLHQYTLKNMTDDIESIRENLLGEQAIGIIGHSTGGHQVFDYAIRYPNHVFKVISLHGGASGLGFLTQTYYRLNEWTKAVSELNSADLIQLQQLVQSGIACDQDGSSLAPATWNLINSFALYGTVAQRTELANILKSLINGNVTTNHFCNQAEKNMLPKVIPILSSSDPIAAISSLNTIINQNVICSNFMSEKVVASLSKPFQEYAFNYIWKPQCSPLLKAQKINESQFDVRSELTRIHVPIMILGSDSDQWIPSETQEEAWKNLTAEQKQLGSFVQIKGCGHFSFFECPKALKKAIDHFLK